MAQWRPVSEVDRDLVFFIRGYRPFLSLKIGDVVEAEVLEIISDNEVLIRLKNRVVEAKTELPLKVGERLLLKVESKEDGVRLRWVKNMVSQDWLKTTVDSLLHDLKGVKSDIKGLRILGDILNRLPDAVKEGLEGDSILKRLPLPMEGLSGSVLKDILESSGVFFETRLKLLVLKNMQDVIREELARIVKTDLKGALLKIKGLLRTSGFIEHLVKDGIKPQELSNLIDGLEKTIEYHQLQSSLNESFQTFLPLLWETLRGGELIFKGRDGDLSGGRTYYCIIRLEFERMGRLVVWVIMQQKGFYITFVTDNHTFLNLLQNNMGFLKEQFDAAGLKLSNLMTRYEERIDSINIPEGLDIMV